VQPTFRTPVLCVTVDVDLADGTAAAKDQSALTTAARSLQSILGHHGVPAAWAMPDPAASPLAESILNASAAHELALLADDSWAREGDSRGKFFQRLSGQLEHARARGIQISNLALARGAVIGHTDLLVKHGVQLVRDDPSTLRKTGWYGQFTAGRSKAQLPTPMRWGLWRLTPSICLPGNSFTAVRRCLDSTSSAAGLITLVLDLNELAAGGRSAMRLVDRVVSMLARRVERKSLTIEVPRDLAAHLSPTRQTAPARSILHRAA